MDLLNLNILPDELLARTLGDGQTLGEAIDQLAAINPDPTGELENHRAEWPVGWLELAGRTDYAEQSLKLATEVGAQCEELVVCGIGGSALGTQAVLAALDWPLKDLKPVNVLDNIDPSLIAQLAESVDWPATALNVISKSGGTLETMAGFLYMLRLYQQLGPAAKDKPNQIVATTDESQGLLHDYATKQEWPLLPVPADVGGRFSVFTPVGLFPLAFAGVDILALLEGADQLQEYCLSLPTRDNPAWQLAALHYLLHTEGGVSGTVQYIYGDPLVLLGDWWRQLWAESLAKATKLDGTPSGIGQTPVVSRGTTDQHSQNQLYMEGPDDKLYGLMSCSEWPVNPQVMLPEASELTPLNYLDRRGFGEVLSACYAGTREALTNVGRPVYEVGLPRLGEAEIGAWLQLWMLATGYAGLLYGVNAFDQPGVELSKQLTKARLSD